MILHLIINSCQLMRSEARLDSNGLSQIWQGRPDLPFQSLGKGATLDRSARLWSTDGSVRALWLNNFRWVVQMTCVRGGSLVPLNSWCCGPSVKFVVCYADTTDQIRQCSSIVIEWEMETMFLFQRRITGRMKTRYSHSFVERETEECQMVWSR